ncbi:FAD/NAD(P)-binding domain-containing protein [Lentithecium fluviatile CBS 122367]|uniref:FAD/NAD(P)-binding domain-containing protein n=1 Tax=Lentithecium fluviatile CBS 122367 TaxID=1168545 RepID=A0A6G1JAW3_9PLEO|nr:FAD/NAD(P)-binding domain-containing protein [Lentithecium fluviatile CBS 122367]
MYDHKFRVIIIGAGLSGIIAAQRYLDVHSQTRLVILEKDKHVGGVFSQSRTYGVFWTQWTVGLSEYSDMPMQRPPESDCRNDFYRAKWTTHYLEQYVDRKDEQGHTLRDRIRFGIDVENIKKVRTSWKISCKDAAGSTHTFDAKKLLIASGLTSVPDMPFFSGAEEFEGPILHSGDFGAREHDILSSEGIKKIAIIGGGKSSADMLYSAVKAGKEVSWIIRTTGTGAAMPNEAASSRIVASISPSIFNAKNWWTYFLHSTSVGTWLLRCLIAKMDAEVRNEANYKGRESVKGFEKLEYDAPLFWQNGTGGLLHHHDFWDLVAKNVYIYRDTVTSASKGLVHLSSGESLQCDAILCGTGWIPSLNFIHEEELVRLGLPHNPNALTRSIKDKWSSLEATADKKITSTYPLLVNPPPHPHKPHLLTPYRLYRHMLPLSGPSVLFLNHVKTGYKILIAEAQAIWAVAHFSGHLTPPSSAQMEEEVALWVAFSKSRYLSAGEEGNNVAFESVTYADCLLRDLGCRAQGKGKGWWRDLVEPFWPRDLGRA